LKKDAKYQKNREKQTSIKMRTGIAEMPGQVNRKTLKEGDREGVEVLTGREKGV
jgi:hypothetical protein